jgi:hypothetical protein
MNIKETMQERSIQAMKAMVEMRMSTRGVGDGDGGLSKATKQMTLAE